MGLSGEMSTTDVPTRNSLSLWATSACAAGAPASAGGFAFAGPAAADAVPAVISRAAAAPRTAAKGRWGIELLAGAGERATRGRWAGDPWCEQVERRPVCRV